MYADRAMNPLAGVGIPVAFGAGLISFLSPCVLPLVPGYLSAVSGVSIADMRSGERGLGTILWPAAIFCLSFTIMFVALGMTATGIGSTLRDSKQTLDRAAGFSALEHLELIVQAVVRHMACLPYDGALYLLTST